MKSIHRYEIRFSELEVIGNATKGNGDGNSIAHCHKDALSVPAGDMDTCIQNHLAATIGCRLPWVNKRTGSGNATCTNKQIKDYLDVSHSTFCLIWLN